MSRAISAEFLADLKEGMLSRLTSAVRNDDTLLLALRGSSINVYYRGGSILRLERRGHRDYSAFFDKNYARASEASLPSTSATVATEADCLAWLRAFPLLKEAMNSFLATHAKSEREFQQLVAWENNRSAIANDTEYFITDIEYADTTQAARLDMLGLKWRSKERKDGTRCTPVIIEMKYGIDAYGGKSGIVEHVKDLNKILGDPAKRRDLSDTIADQFKQLDALKLLHFNRSIAFKGVEFRDDKPEVVLLLANGNPRSRKLLTTLQSIEDPKDYNLRFFVASFAGYGMHEACMLKLDDFCTLLKNYPT